MKKSYQIKVYGRVQGVGFRWFTQNLAQEYHIVGWVQNKNDGTVDMKIQGDAIDVTSFLEKLKQGPGPYSHVEKIIKQSIALFESNNFAIR
ncbi:acylphosphatase [Leuconostoc rapi]|uniref:acylphosphatase n=1 Tax=Leuconostoc rapi TaxID=1406906 RepID=UPI00195C0176|nr:acylphosphatase [Leuconostoc rapi]MBM7435985.1 acylphosphatase [Leuconostoc rapi]